MHIPATCKTPTIVMRRALVSALVVSLLAVLPACSSPSCVDSLGLGVNLSDATYHLHALTVLLRSDSPHATKVGQEQGLLFYALVDVSDGLRHTAPAISNGYQDAAHQFQGVNAKNIPRLRRATTELQASLMQLDQQLQDANNYCNVS